jgi:aspartyl protease family protein
MKHLARKTLSALSAKPTVCRRLVLALLALLWAWGELPAAQPGSAPEPQTLAAQLQHLAQEQGFEISGLKRIQPAPPAEAGEGTSIRRIRRLLSGYDHVIIHQSKERIGRLIILGKKRAAPPPPPPDEENVLPTRRLGGHHLVAATLRGPTSAAIEMELMVDTGASLVVLPASAATRLGLDPDKLEARELQTAKGKVQAKIGRLGSIELGSAKLNVVVAAFVVGEHLGGNALLGMNVLGR